MFNLPSVRERRIRALRRKGDAAMAHREWRRAADWYAEVIKIRALPTIQVQLGHALREVGDLTGAARAYGSVPQTAAEGIDARFYRGETLRQMGDITGAIDSFVAVLQADSAHRGAYAGLIHLGARDRLPDDFQRKNVPGALLRVEEELRRLRGAVSDLAEVSTYPLQAYDAFRHAYPIKPPPRGDVATAITVLIDAREIGAAFIRATLLSLIDQTVRDWRAEVLADGAICAHPVASLAGADPRIVFLPETELALPRGLILHISAGTVFDPETLAWFGFASARTASPALWCDFDHAAEDLGGVLRYREPRLWGIHDRDLLAETSSPPAAVLVDTNALDLPYLNDMRSAEWRRKALLTTSRAVHVPRILATVLRLPDRAVNAPIDGEIALWSAEPDGSPPTAGESADPAINIVMRGARPAVSITRVVRPNERLQLVIQTRDEGEMLRTAISTLLSKASRRDRFDLTIVDNRTTDLDTLAYLDSLASKGIATVVAHDEAFNWARANNLATRQSQAEHIVFINNDVEMLTDRWDDLLLGYLQRDEVGVVGARLLYPDGAIQHAGVLFGIGEGGPLHDGVRASQDDTGPLDRFDVTHAAAAVTGAFMGVRRAVFDEIGGFDDIRFAIGYNDIDFCLSARATKRTIIYTPAIELIHHESKTRGHNIGRARVAWDIGEFTALRERWCDNWSVDPSYNIHWSRTQAFDGFCEPTTTEITQAIDRGAQADPWQSVKSWELASFVPLTAKN